MIRPESAWTSLARERWDADHGEGDYDRRVALARYQPTVPRPPVIKGEALELLDENLCSPCLRVARPIAEKLTNLATFLDRASEVISDETGMVVCWHEFADAQDVLASGCVQCIVEYARTLAHVPART